MIYLYLFDYIISLRQHYLYQVQWVSSQPITQHPVIIHLQIYGLYRKVV